MGQASYKINEKWKVSANIRYNYDDKYGTETSRYIDFNAATINAAAPFLGANTPALDITSVLACPTGTPGSCNSGPLAPGVKTKGIVLPNGLHPAATGDIVRRLHRRRRGRIHTDAGHLHLRPLRSWL